MSDITPPEPPAYTPPVAASGPVGKVRNPIVVILLAIVTLGIYTLFWYYAVHKEMKDHTGEGLGGGVALLIAFFVSPVMLFLTPHEVGGMYTRAGQEPPTSWKTGLWIFLPIAGAFIWVFKVQNAMNARWTAAAA
jgi:drug/metabolite transporter (DMT)-like permease